VKDWNVVVSIYQDGFRRALRALRELGSVERSPYYNVLLMRVEDPTSLLEAIERRTKESTALYDAISRVAPAMRNIEFKSAEEFKEKAKSILLEWWPRLAGRSFHARLRRRGARYGLRTLDIEQFLVDALLDTAAEVGTPCKVSFTCSPSAPMSQI
jgi:tRNA(Ser,Leu) C12 N-acetylase TAN1